jgi:hypothetical protein
LEDLFGGTKEQFEANEIDVEEKILMKKMNLKKMILKMRLMLRKMILMMKKMILLKKLKKQLITKMLKKMITIPIQTRNQKKMIKKTLATVMTIQ